MQNQINFSIIIPIYNHANYLKRCLNSIKYQLIEGDEIFLINDNSTDNLLEVYNEINITQFPYFELISFNEHKGVSACRNAGIKQAKNEWIKFLDADDMLAPNSLENFREYIPKYAKGRNVVVGNQCYINKDGKILMDGNSFLMIRPNINQIERANPFCLSMTFVKKSVIEEVGYFNEAIEFEEDWDLWLRIYKKYGISTFMHIDHIIDLFNCEAEERKERDKLRKHEVEGMDVRDYFAREYGIKPLK